MGYRDLRRLSLSVKLSRKLYPQTANRQRNRRNQHDGRAYPITTYLTGRLRNFPRHLDASFYTFDVHPSLVQDCLPHRFREGDAGQRVNADDGHGRSCLLALVADLLHSDEYNSVDFGLCCDVHKCVEERKCILHLALLLALWPVAFRAFDDHLITVLVAPCLRCCYNDRLLRNLDAADHRKRSRLPQQTSQVHPVYALSNNEPFLWVRATHRGRPEWGRNQGFNARCSSWLVQYKGRSCVLCYWRNVDARGRLLPRVRFTQDLRAKSQPMLLLDLSLQLETSEGQAWC